jgi:hypothetical protein
MAHDWKNLFSERIEQEVTVERGDLRSLPMCAGSETLAQRGRGRVPGQRTWHRTGTMRAGSETRAHRGGDPGTAHGASTERTDWRWVPTGCRDLL